MASNGDTVVILHGIGMPRLRMAYIDLMLRRAGYKPLNIGYPSLKFDIARCADFVAEKLQQKGIHKDSTPIHIIAHSMGGLVALDMIGRRAIPVRRAVLIAPPYKGSEVADFLHTWKLYQIAFGPAGAQLTTQARATLETMIPDGTEIGVIAGTRAYEYPLFLHVMKKTGLHDGLVSVESTKIPGMKDHITIRMSHSFLIERSASQAVHFLAQGHFNHGSDMTYPHSVHRA